MKEDIQPTPGVPDASACESVWRPTRSRTPAPRTYASAAAVKCSSDHNSAAWSCSNTAWKKLYAISLSRRRCDSRRTPSCPSPDRPSRAPRTIGTAGCTRAAPSACARCESSRAPGGAEPGAASLVDSRAAPRDGLHFRVARVARAEPGRFLWSDVKGVVSERRMGRAGAEPLRSGPFRQTASSAVRRSWI